MSLKECQVCAFFVLMTLRLPLSKIAVNNGNYPNLTSVNLLVMLGNLMEIFTSSKNEMHLLK